MVEKYPGQLKVVFKNFPLRNHQMALPAAQAALAAHKQGKFWPYHDKLFASFNNLNEASLQKFASEAGLDIAKFNSDRTSPAVSQQINQDMQGGLAAGVRGTPTIFVNGLLLKERSLTEVSRLIDSELNRLKE